VNRAARIARCLEPQERFEAIRRDAERKHGRALADLSYANAADGPASAVKEALRGALEAARPADLQYTPYGGATLTRREIARALERSHGLPFHYRDVILTPGAMAALNVAFRVAQAEHEDAEAVVVTPCWIDYPLYLAHLGIAARLVPSRPSLRLDLDAIRAALGPRTRMVVLSQPSNPSGVLYRRDELDALARLLDDAPTRPLLISDECHRDVVFDRGAFVSPACAYDRSLVIYSFGKSLFMQGQRIGYVAVSPRMAEREGVARELERACRYMGFCTPTALMQMAVRRLLRLPIDLAPIDRRRRLVCDALRAMGYETTPNEATFFVYPRVPADGSTGARSDAASGDADDMAFCARLADEGVLAMPAAVFHHRGHFRLSLTASDATIDRALPALARATRAAKR
jgi:aspartate aminotransferase